MYRVLSLVFFFVAFHAHFVFSQFVTVAYDHALNVFGNYEPLPAEQAIMFSGLVPAGIDMVEVLVFSEKGGKKRKPLAQSSWRREVGAAGQNATTFKIAMNYPLEAGKNYDLYINYLALVDSEEREELIRLLMNTMDAYLRKTFEIKGRKLYLEGKSKEIYKQLNEIVHSGLEAYRFPPAFGFKGFSPLVAEHLKSLNKVHVDNLSDMPLSSQDSSFVKRVRKKRAAKRRALELKKRQAKINALEGLEQVVETELRLALQGPFWRLTDVRFLDDYPTKKRKGYFAVHLGYGAALIERQAGRLDYGSSAYAGLSVPLATSRLAPVFLRNASMTAGFFFDNFTDDAGQVVSGPVFQRPLYLGLDYKLFQFFRINLGAAFLERPVHSGVPASTETALSVKPFVGLSAKINLSLSFDE